MYLIVLMVVIPLFLLFAKEQITNFEDLMNKLNSGEEVRIIMHYGDCQLISDNKISVAPRAIGGMSIDTYEYFAKGSIRNKLAFVAFSESKLINMRDFVINYVKVKITSDDKVRIVAQYVNPKTYEIEMNESFYTEINDKKNDGAVYLYTD